MKRSSFKVGDKVKHISGLKGIIISINNNTNFLIEIEYVKQSKKKTGFCDRRQLVLICEDIIIGTEDETIIF